MDPKSAEDQLGVTLSPDPELVVEEEVTQDDGRPEWLPENFKAPEDLVTSYKEAQAELNRQRQQSRALEQRIEELAEVQQQQPRYQQQYQHDNPLMPYATALANATGLDEESALQQLQLHQTLTQMQIQHAMQQNQQMPPQTDPNIVGTLAEQLLASDLGELWGEVREDVEAELDKAPYLIPTSNDPREIAEAVKRVARMVAAEKGITQAQPDHLSRQQKLLAQTVPGQGGRSVTSVDPLSALKEGWRQAGVIGYNG